MDEAQLVADVAGRTAGLRPRDFSEADLSYVDPETGFRYVVQMNTAANAQDPVVVGRVKEALENDLFKWRTIRGISKETGVGRDVVKMVIAKEVPDLIVASALSESGEPLFSTRRHYKRNSTFFDRVIGVLKNRAV